MTKFAPEGSVAIAVPAEHEVPSWDLTDLYESPRSPNIEADLAASDNDGRAFQYAYAGRLANLPGRDLAAAIDRFQVIDEKLGRLTAYAQLLFSGNSTDPIVGQFYQYIVERCTAISAHILFFGLELNRIEDAVLEAKFTDAALSHWKPYLRNLRAWRKHQLSDELERFVHDREVTSRTAWSRLFDETIAGMRVPFGTRHLTVDAALNRLSDPDRTIRETAAAAISQAFGERSKFFSLVTNTLAKDKEIIDAWRHFPRASSDRHISNVVEDEVVDALVTAVISDFPRLSHRYYSLKAKWLGLERLQHWDRNAPLPGSDDTTIIWPEAKDTVLGAYDKFDPDLAAIGHRFFAGHWIDAVPRDGKSGGAFAHPTVPSVHPYILMNFHGRTRDVMTLAHELGHGVHQVLAAKQGHLMSGTPLTLAETASVFGEMLTFQALLQAETNADRSRLMLASKVEDMLNTVIRQIAFYQFETLVHEERRAGEILPQRLGEIWLQVQRDSLGPAFDLSPDYAIYWAYIPHFIHSPFYVYAYAFGDCLVNALYTVFRSGHPGFETKYKEMLRAGGTRTHRELLAPFGLDATDPAFWRLGLDVISGFIDQLEAGAHV